MKDIRPQKTASYLDFFKQNSRSHIIVDGHAYTIDQFLKLY